MDPASTFKITCTWLTGGATELPVVFLSPDGSDIGGFDPIPLTLEPESEEAPPCQIEIAFNSETQFELHRFEIISANKNLEVYRDEECGGYLATLKGSPVEVDSQQAFKFVWDAKSPEMIRALRFKMQSQLLAQLLFSKMGMKANLPSIPPTASPTPNSNNNTNNNHKEHFENNNSNNIITKPSTEIIMNSAGKELPRTNIVHEPHDEISQMIARQEQKYVQLLSDVERRMDEKLSKLQSFVEHRFNELERAINSNNRINSHNSDEINKNE